MVAGCLRRSAAISAVFARAVPSVYESVPITTCSGTTTMPAAAARSAVRHAVESVTTTVGPVINRTIAEDRSATAGPPPIDSPFRPDGVFYR